MALAIGTTARQMNTMARWMLAATIVLGMLTWWWPGFRQWGAMTAGLLAVLAMWLCWRTLAADRSLAGHPFLLALMGPAAVLVYHLMQTGLGLEPAETMALAGGLNMAMIFHVALLALAVTLTQTLLSGQGRRPATLCACALAMMGGAWGAVVCPSACAARHCTAMIGFAGAAVWAAGVMAAPVGPLIRRVGLAAGLAAAVGLAVAAPEEAALAATVSSVICLVGAIGLQRLRWPLLAAAGVLAASAAVALLLTMHVLPDYVSGLRQSMGGWGWLGAGEHALTADSTRQGSLLFLGAATGWLGAGWLAAGLLGSGLRLVIPVRSAPPPDQSRAVLWAVAVALASVSMLAPGGLFIPAATMAVALTWGLLPAMTGRDGSGRPIADGIGGFVMAAFTLALIIILGLAREDGLVEWTATSFFGGNCDWVLHSVVGFLVAMMLAWLAGGRSTWRGLAGIAAATLAGGIGELMQGLLSTRSMEFRDWCWHAIGTAAAVPLYLLCRGARWSEDEAAGLTEVKTARRTT